jgi:hypothetical protein
LTAAAVLSLVSQYPDWDHEKAVWVVFKESSYRTDATNPAGPFYGLFQISAIHGYSAEQLHDPATNVAVAYRLYQERGWTPWPVAAKFAGSSNMGVTQDGWFDWAQRMPGPPEKVWEGTNTLAGIVFHSAVGSLQGVVNVVFGPVENQRSVTGVVGYDGRFIQFYPVTACPWANGNRSLNMSLLGFEFEGGRDTPATVSEPLTVQQEDVSVRILRDLAEYKRVPVSFWQRPTTLKEHREISATACPSGRITWPAILQKLASSPSPTSSQQLDAVLAVALQIHEFSLGKAVQPISQERKAVFAAVNDLVQRQ